MDVYALMELHKDELTPRERYVYDAVLENGELVRGSSSTELARALGVSQSVISRFCQKIGFSGYGDFRMNFYQTSGQLGVMRDDEESRDVADYYAEAIREVRHALPDELLEGFAQQIVAARDVYISGFGGSAVPAHMLATLLSQDAIRCHALTAGDEVWPLHYANDKDLYVLFSMRNPSHASLVTTAGEMSPERRPHIILVTSTATHPLSKKVDEVVVLPVWSSAQNPVYLSPIYASMLFCMFLSHVVSGLIEKR